MSIDELLDTLDDTIDEAPTVPFTGKHMVDVDKLRDIIDEIRLNLPTEIRQAKAIVQDRTDIIATAKKEGDSIVKRAEDRARAMVSQEAVVKAAQERANEIATAAQNDAREMRTKITEYCDDLLEKTERELVKEASEVKTLRTTLRQSGRSTARTAEQSAASAPAQRSSARSVKVSPKPQQ